MSVGLDIGSKTIKVVELSKEKNKFALKGVGVAGYSGQPLEALKDDAEMASLAETLKKLFKDAKISSKQVSLSLPEPQVFTRVIKFPLLTDQEISSAVKWEAEQYIPIPVADAVIQHQILERKETATPPSVSVLLIAAPRVLVDKYIKVVGMAGLTTMSLETSLLALERALAPEKGSVFLLDFGSRSTNIAIVKDSQLVFSRSIPTAGEVFTRAVSQALGVDLRQAEEYKRTYGFIESQLEGKVAAALTPVLRVVTDEIRKATHFYQSELQGASPTALIISGGSVGLPEVIGTLTKNLNIEVVIGNPFSKVVVGAETAKSLAAYAPLYPVAVGLALRGE